MPSSVTTPPPHPSPPGTQRSPWIRVGPYSTPRAYGDRTTKASYIAEKYAPLLAPPRRVLDVGCDARQLARAIGAPERYVGVDRSPPADRELDLDRANLPFDDRSFDTVVCCDVLEHLERCHAVFDELCRVSADAVIVSLPNAVQSVVQSLLELRAGRTKYYGLPLDPPADRHRWFFGFDEAAEFLTRRGERCGFSVQQLDASDASNAYWHVGKDARDALDTPNAKLGTCWAALRRKV